jgi:ribonuclease P protein component
MLPGRHRFSTNKDFEKVAKRGRFIFSPEIGIKWIKNDFNFSRFGIIVPLKASKKAVIRNKIKRRLRAIISQNFMAIKPGYDIMILAKPQIINFAFGELRNKLESLLKRARLLSGDQIKSK